MVSGVSSGVVSGNFCGVAVVRVVGYIVLLVVLLVL